MENLRIKNARMGNIGQNSPRERNLPYNEAVLNYDTNGLIHNTVQKLSACIVYIGHGRRAEVADLIYHYTSQDVFDSMLSTGELWATNYRSLNDYTEINYALDLLRRRIGANGKNKPYKIEKFEAVVRGIVGEDEFYIVSFSQDGNLLSQWRAYAPVNGVSIGFASSLFPRFSYSLEPYNLREVVYNQIEQVNLIEPWAQEIAKIIDVEEDLDMISRNVAQYRIPLLRVIPYLKHHGFSEEKEVRLVTLGKNYTKFKRQGKSGEIEFVKISFRDAFIDCEPLDMPISTIFCGPTNNPNRKLNEVYEIMRKHKEKFDVITECDIPFR